MLGLVAIAAPPAAPAATLPDSTVAVWLATVAPGTFLRVRFDSDTWEGGSWRVTADSLVLGTAAAAQPLPLGSIAAVDERRARSGRGARIGGIVGAVMGATALAIAARSSDDDGFCESDCGVGSTFPVLIGGALGGALAGAFLGAVTGSFFPAWVPVYRRP
jgi:hypothetical protein